MRRFPVTLAYAFLAVTLIIYAIESEANGTGIYRYILTSLLGVPLSFSISVYAERHNLKQSLRIACHAVAAIMLSAYFVLFLPANLVYAAAIRFSLVAVLVHVWVAFAAYPRGSSVLTFWQFNRSLFLRFAVASLFAGVLYIGLVIAFLSFDSLLGIKINPKRYAELFFVCAGIIHPWFFLAGVPRNFDHQADDYPPVLRIFAQYILIPLVAIYVLILYLYSIKVIAHWEWPRYKATYLVGLFSAPGILATLLLYPLSVSAWVKRYTRFFYLLLVPLVLMMLLCVYRRVTEHGLTEMMVIAITMGVWLLFISIFMLKTGGNNIRAVPASLVVFLLVAAFGPFSATSLGQSSQTARLTNILRQEKISGGKIELADKRKIKLPMAAYSQVIDKSRYLADHFGPEALVPFVNGDGSTLAFERSESGALRRRTGYEAHNIFISHFLNTAPAKSQPAQYSTFHSKHELITLKGYSNLIRHQSYRSEETRKFTGTGYELSIDWQEDLLFVKTDKGTGAINFGKLYAKLRTNYTGVDTQVKQTQLAETFRFGDKNARIQFLRMAGENNARDIDFILFLP